MKGASLTLVRRFRAPPEQVWAACTDPALMAQWFGPREWRVIELSAEVRVGGAFSFRMTGPDGIVGAIGTYETVEPPHRLVHSWRWNEGTAHPPEPTTSRVSYLIEPDGDGSRLTFTHEGLADQASADGHRAGWSEALDKLGPLLEPRSG